jgi:DNA-binding LacI/PurR family transcriptional regulator
MEGKSGREVDRDAGSTDGSVRRGSGPATMADVARLAGMSIATVSRAFNGESSVRPENRDRVARAIEAVGYRPNRVAMNLRRQKVEMIGVLVSDIENPHFTATVRAAEAAAYRHGYRVLLCNTDEQASKQSDYLNVLAAERVGGAILSPTDPGAPEIRHLLDLGIQLVAFDRRVLDGRASSVTAANRAGALLATRHLLGLGHTRIGMLAGADGVQTSDERREGYAHAMEASGLQPLVADGGFRIEPSRAAAERLLEHRDMTALITANNLASIGALQALQAAGRRVPDDVALVTMDDPPWASLMTPALTALAQPVQEMAECAVALLLDGLEHRDHVPQHVSFDFELRVRGSCGTVS